ncbi:hypothetical protein [Actinoplanes sp. NPDC049265]|uniref:hypothetical protein n=1 Tax=Actinoplanes sp. NPDC049265 TaxID=3363902 RepID=UPI0037146346
MRVPFDDKTGNGKVMTILAHRIDGKIGAIQGDSGGPVYKNVTSTRVNAVGMIQAVGWPLASCGSIRDGGRNICSNDVYFTAMSTIIRTIPGASLVTG